MCQYQMKSGYQKQSGAVLIVSLMVLLILTLLAMSSSQTIILQEKMTAAVRDSHLALEEAEATLVEGEDYIVKYITSDAQFKDSDGLYDGVLDQLNPKATLVSIDPSDSAWWDDSSHYKTLVNADGEVKGKYTIRYNGPISEDDSESVMLCNNGTCDASVAGLDMFTVYARGEGRDSGVRILVSQYAKKMN